MENQITTPQEPVVSSPKSKLPVILLVVVLLFLFGMGGLFLGKNLYAPKVITPKPTVIQTTTADVTANWKTYTNTYGNFAIKHPSNWLVNEDIGPIDKQINIVDFYLDEKDNITKSPITELFKIYVQDNPDKVSLDKLALNYDKPETFNFSGGQGIKGYDKNALTNGTKDYTANIIDGNLIFTFKMGVLTKDNSLDTFDQILSTFKFTSL